MFKIFYHVYMYVHSFGIDTSLIMMSLCSTVVCAKPGLLGNDNLPLLRFILGNDTWQVTVGFQPLQKSEGFLEKVLGKGQLFRSVSKLLVVMIISNMWILQGTSGNIPHCAI